MPRAIRSASWVWHARDRKSTRLNSSHLVISYAVFCLKKKKRTDTENYYRRGEQSQQTRRLSAFQSHCHQGHICSAETLHQVNGGSRRATPAYLHLVT